jgi:hypothetical protein
MLIYAAVLIFGVNLFLQYGLWLLPLVIARGRLRTAAAASATLCVPLVFRYAGELGWRSTVWSTNAVLGLYVPVMDLLLFATVAGVVITVTEIERSRAVVRAPRRAVPSYRLLGGLATAAAVVATVGTVAVAAGGHGSGPPSTVAVQGAGPAVMLGAPSGGVAGATVPASTAPNRPGARRSPSVSASPASTPAATHHRAGSTTTAPPSCASTCTSSSAPAGSKPHLAAPTLARVAPAVGLVSGGTRVVLYGTGFTRDATVRFGMLTLPNVTWVSSKELAVDAPPAAQVRSATDLAGAVHGLVVQIVVSTAAGHSATGALAAFTYL